jgi:hypothetical protein
MDAHHFDALTRRLTLGLSRRRTLGLLGSVGLPGLIAPDAAAAKKAKKAKKKKPCPPCKKRKKGKCKGLLPDGTACAGGTCQRGSCVPTQQTVPPPPPPMPVVPPPPIDPCPGQKLCNGTCIPTNQCCTRQDCPALPGNVCCNGGCTDAKLEPGFLCSNDTNCCSEYCRDARPNEPRCAATCRGKRCTLDSDCCPGITCQLQNPTFATCGGCSDGGFNCASDEECCFTDCTQVIPGFALKACMSQPGGPCEKSLDCRSCFGTSGQCTVVRNGVPGDVCLNGTCGCPYECCVDNDCRPAEICVTDEIGLNGKCTPNTGD